MQHIENYINGELVAAHSKRSLHNVEPATGEAYSTTPDSDERDVGDAVRAAQGAFENWRLTPASERSCQLLRIADLIERDLDVLAEAESRDNGKPVSLARAVDIPRAAANFRFFATAILHDRSDAHITDTRAINYTLRRARGVAGLISPWNLPLYLLTWKIAPALATGNTAVAKPSEITPMTAYLLSKICIEAGLPPGVLNIVHGTGPSAGSPLVAHPDVPAISFTGGTTTGATIARIAAPMFKKLSLELGGKNPTVVFGDVDLDRILPELVRASFANQGQICLCGSRILVERTLYEQFVDRFVDAVQALAVGDPTDPETQQGALVSRSQLEKVKSYVELARDEGGRIRCGGHAPSDLPARCREGFFFLPTVVTDLAPDCRVQQEEIFGPVVTISPFDSESEAIDLANGTAYGLAASIWTHDLDRAHRVGAAVDAGVVWINCWLLRDLRTPFGGMKQSGVGREGGDEALRFFTEPQNICVHTP